MLNFNRINIISGWIVFLISATAYLLTIEPTVSFWDCGEFLASGYKLQVGHPPGAPFYMLLTRLFAIIAPSPEKVAMFVNGFSALISAATIMFLFWTISHLGKKLVPDTQKQSVFSDIVVLGAGFIGSLSYAFTDTFWFSAVEAEVYAFSSFFTAVVFWAILKWENDYGEPRANRWIILIAYLMGISIGIHLLNLLTIPAIAFIYYFKRYKASPKGYITTFLISCLILAIIMWGIIPGLPGLAGWFELMFVNGFGLPYNSGLIFFILLTSIVLGWGIWTTHKKNKILYNTILTGVALIILGYASFAVIVIRAGANPPMNENNPDNVFSLQKYLNREQYGERPLFYGHYYNAPAIDQKDGKPAYIKKEGKYVKTNPFPQYVYDDRFNTFMPRMYSSNPRHAEVYKDWGKIKGRPVRVPGPGGELKTVQRPTFFENLRFSLTYQVGHMYLRYFLWNFAGRQNDIQGHGGVLYGNWISGIPFIDNLRLGKQEMLPGDLANNKSRNRYFLLPLILGLIGFFFHYGVSRKGKQDWWVVLLLFVFTGIAIVIYLNQTPLQPRERDYAYAGSFYAFAIWIGIGVIAVTRKLNKYLNKKISAMLALVLCMSVPIILIAENWDDHNRSGRFMARDYAINYLESCAPNAVLFTYGDNDTFPLWYVQDVEGIRTDIRICNLNLLSTDWYNSQMRGKVYESEPLPFSTSVEGYEMGKRDYIPVLDKIERYIDLKRAVKFVGSERLTSKISLQSGEKIDYLPTKRLFIEVDREEVLANGTVQPEDRELIADSVKFTLNRSGIGKNDFAILDFIASNNWERPVYFDLSTQKALNLGLNDYLQLEGLAYRLVPIHTPQKNGQAGHINSKILYNNMMNKFTWGNIQDTTLWIDDNNIREVKIIEAKPTAARLAMKLLQENKPDSAKKVLDRYVETFPEKNIPLDFDDLMIAEVYYNMDQNNKANDIVKKLSARTIERLEYYASLPNLFISGLEMENRRQIAILSNCVNIARKYNQTELSRELDELLKKLIGKFGALS
jgi:hypothetical protein